MACRNALLIRYKIEVKPGECNNDPGLAAIISANTTNGVVNGITKVNGLDLGEEGTVEVPDWDVKYTVSDGKRVIPTLGLQYRVDADLKTFNLISYMFQNRHSVSVDWSVKITDRAWNTLYQYIYKDSQIRKHGQEDQELGASKLGLIDTLYSPSDVMLLDAQGTPLVYKAAAP